MLKYINEAQLDFKGMYNGGMCLFEKAEKLLGPFSSELANFYFVFVLLFVFVCVAWLAFCALITWVFIDKNPLEVSLKCMKSDMDYHTLERAATVDRGNAQLLIEKLIARIYVLEQKLQSIAAEMEAEETTEDASMLFN